MEKIQNKIYIGNCVDAMQTFPVDVVDLVITSPPYDSLRSYQGFTFDYKAIIKELWRVIKPGGVIVWVVGDAVIKGSESGTSFRHALAFIDQGFRLHDTMIYEKNGAAYPANEKSNRYSQIFEYMFVFSKGAPKTHNLICDKANRWAGWEPFGENSERQKDGDIKKRGKFVVKDFSPRNNIWKINNGFGYTTKDKWAYEHPAMFPEQLALDHIKTWSNPGDLVLDPMCGAGTTLKAAKQLGRNYIGIDISPEYVKLAQKRVESVSSLPGVDMSQVIEVEPQLIKENFYGSEIKVNNSQSGGEHSRDSQGIIIQDGQDGESGRIDQLPDKEQTLESLSTQLSNISNSNE